MLSAFYGYQQLPNPAKRATKNRLYRSTFTHPKMFMKKSIPLGVLACACLLNYMPVTAQKKPAVKKTTSPVKIVAAPKSIHPANLDLSVKPGDDFYRYANGAWLKNNPIPASKTSWGSMDVIRLTNLERLKALCEEAGQNSTKNSINQRVGDLYASAMDTTTIEQLGSKPVMGELVRLSNLSTKKEILDEITTLRSKGVGGLLFGFSIGQDDKDVNSYIPRLSQGGTSLPDRDYYLKTDQRSETIRKAYVSYITDMFRLADDDDVTAAAKAAAIMRIETSLAAAQMSRVEMRDPVKTYNKFSVAAFSKTTPNLNWVALLVQMQVKGADSLLVNNPAFFKAADSLFVAVPVADWKAYLQWATLKSKAPYLSSAFVKRNFEFTRVLSGQKEMTPRWQTMTGVVDGNLGELLGQLYVEKYFTADAKQRMLAMVKNIQETFAGRIRRVDWMEEATRQKALEKLDAIVNKIGFPDKWETYNGVVISRTDLVGNIDRVNEWEYQDMVRRMGQPVDKTEWGMTPPTVNAYYRASNNEIAFPAGILQPPFFDFSTDDAVNYGGIAAVIGHELTHGFDDKGRQYAADGNLKDWWTQQDAERFKARATEVVEQFNAYTVNDTIHVNGKLTLGENLADLGGLNIAYEAFKKTEQGKSGKKIDGFTPDQRFFLSWAQVWRKNILPESAAQLIVVDPHSPGPYRVNGPVSNMDAWYAAFNVQPGDKMYKPKEKRTLIW
jgi:putative endopeptidase